MELLRQVELVSFAAVSHVDRVELGQSSLGVEKVRRGDVASPVREDVAVMLPPRDVDPCTGAKFSLHIPCNSTIVVVLCFVLSIRNQCDEGICYVAYLLSKRRSLQWNTEFVALLSARKEQRIQRWVQVRVQWPKLFEVTRCSAAQPSAGEEARRIALVRDPNSGYILLTWFVDAVEVDASALVVGQRSVVDSFISITEQDEPEVGYLKDKVLF